MTQCHNSVLTGSLCKTVLLLACLAMLPACTGVSGYSGNSVAEAYHASDVVMVNPYTRTIFSSGNF